MNLGVPELSVFESMKALRTRRTLRNQRLPTVYWIVAWFFLVAQGMASAIPLCSAADTPSGVASSMAGVNAGATLPMPMAAQEGEPTAATCTHCHPHAQSHGCSGLHGCNAPLSVALAISATLPVEQSQLVVLPATLPGITTLAIDPPQRPPPA